MKRIDAPRAWAWAWDVTGKLCPWAVSSMSKRTGYPGAERTRVRIVREADYRRMYRALKDKEARP